MSRGRSVLLIVEGERAEPRLMRRVFDVYGITDVDIFPYRSNVYDLYRRMFEGCEDAEDLSLRLTLKERETDPEMRRLLDKDYSDTILVFDFDPQDHLFSAQKLSDMVAYFNESTEHGKLYVNYPMVESYRDLTALPYDETYMSRIVDAETLKSGLYKGDVDARSAVPQLEECNGPIFDRILIHNIEKASWLVGCEYTKSDPLRLYERLGQDSILQSQAKLLTDKELVSVLCTCLWCVIDYRPQSMRNHLKTVASQG